MVTYTEVGTVIKGNIIKAEARKISKPSVITKTGRHKTNQITLKDNAVCVIERKLKFIK